MTRRPWLFAGGVATTLTLIALLRRSKRRSKPCLSRPQEVTVLKFEARHLSSKSLILGSEARALKKIATLCDEGGVLQGIQFCHFDQGAPDYAKVERNLRPKLPDILTVYIVLIAGRGSWEMWAKGGLRIWNFILNHKPIVFIIFISNDSIALKAWNPKTVDHSTMKELFKDLCSDISILCLPDINLKETQVKLEYLG